MITMRHARKSYKVAASNAGRGNVRTSKGAVKGSILKIPAMDVLQLQREIHSKTFLYYNDLPEQKSKQTRQLNDRKTEQRGYLHG